MQQRGRYLWGAANLARLLLLGGCRGGRGGGGGGVCVQQHIKSSSFTITTQSNTSSDRSQREKENKKNTKRTTKKNGSGINRATNEEEADDGVQHHQSVQLGIAPGGATWTGENRSVETEKVLARGVRSIRVVLRVLEIWSVTVGNETDERCKDFTKQIGKMACRKRTWNYQASSHQE